MVIKKHSLQALMTMPQSDWSLIFKVGDIAVDASGWPKGRVIEVLHIAGIEVRRLSVRAKVYGDLNLPVLVNWERVK